MAVPITSSGQGGAKWPQRTAPVTVVTPNGVVRGRGEHGVTVFRGIPFAEPPVGALRFAAPVPAAGWDGVRDTISFGPPPPQSRAMATAAARAADGDDWLTVHVWSVALGHDARLPVMVWVHGGAYRAGSAGDPGYDGGVPARDGVVVVTFNHRVGVEGYGRLVGGPANRALLDQVAALEWVRDTISGFGGNPDDVTVFGESAGAGGVASLLAMPRSAGLFHRATGQSMPGTFFSAPLAADIMTEIAARIGRTATVTETATVPRAELVAVVDGLTARLRDHRARWGKVALTATAFSPVVDGDVVTTTPWQAPASGAGRDVDLVVGHDRDEFQLFVAMSGLLRRVSDGLADEALTALGPDPGLFRAAYPSASAQELYSLVWSDGLFRIPSPHLASAQSIGGGRAWLYELTWAAPGLAGALGACHDLDLPLVFGTFTPGLLTDTLFGPQVAPQAQELSRTRRTAWTSFARPGDPGRPRYDHERQITGMFDGGLIVTGSPEQASHRLWSPHSFGPLPLLGP